jgi:predicted NAD-dependent protein-ADP-ribosyltransferase YbiA (DUF1768 family)
MFLLFKWSLSIFYINIGEKIEITTTLNMDKQMKAQNTKNTNWRPVVKTDGLFIMDLYPLEGPCFIGAEELKFMPPTSSGTLKATSSDALMAAQSDALSVISSDSIRDTTSDTLKTEILNLVDDYSDQMSIDDDIDKDTPTAHIISLVNAIIMDMDYSPKRVSKTSSSEVVSTVIHKHTIPAPLNGCPILFRNFMPYDEIGWKSRMMCFSLTYPGVIRVGGITYTSLYHYIVARKARLYSYFGIYKAIGKMTHSPCYPDEGWFEHEYRIKNYDSAITTDYLWDLHYSEVLRCGLHAKFTQINGYRRILDETGNNKLIYVSDDEYLGAKIVDGVVVGENRLGEMLMRLREKLRRA